MKYYVFLSTKVNPKKLKRIKRGEGIIVIEIDDYTKAEITAIKAKGYTVLGYISVGTIEKERTWWKQYKGLALKRLEDWPDEYFADLSNKKWRDFITSSRAKQIKKKGCDGWWCDNIDVCEYYPSKPFGIYVIEILNKLHDMGGYVMINGGAYFINKHNHIYHLDGYTQEEVFSRIKSYKGKGTFGEQTKSQQKVYKSTIKECMKLGIQCFLLEYTRDDKVKEKIKAYCKEGKCTGYYISKEVDL